MNAPYVRFDMLLDGQPQNVGFLVGLIDTGIDFELEEELTEPFHNRLPIPSYKTWEHQPDGYFSGAYFTQAGYDRFEEYIDDIVNEVKKLNNGWEVRVTTSDGFPEEDIFYQDEFQVIVRMAKTQTTRLAS